MTWKSCSSITGWRGEKEHYHDHALIYYVTFPDVVGLDDGDGPASGEGVGQIRRRGIEGETIMGLTKIMIKTEWWLAAFLMEQAEMAAQTELFMEAVPWRTEQ